MHYRLTKNTQATLFFQATVQHNFERYALQVQRRTNRRHQAPSALAIRGARSDHSNADSLTGRGAA
jgi:hypothetical protein